MDQKKNFKAWKCVLILKLSVLLISCSNGAEKFVGHWQPIGKENTREVLVIQEKGNVYEMFNIDTPEQVLLFKYDEEFDRLSFNTGENMIVDINYKKEDGHIIIGPRMPSGFETPVELKKKE